MTRQPAADVASGIEESAYALSAERETGHDGNMQVVVAGVGVEFVPDIRTMHLMAFLHERNLGAHAQPVEEIVLYGNADGESAALLVAHVVSIARVHAEFVAGVTCGDSDMPLGSCRGRNRQRQQQQDGAARP